jgi:tetratricopeptide (TPR) repeat protein
LELLQHSDLDDPDWIRDLTKDEISFHQAVRVLSSHGLVEVDMSSHDLIESRGYSIHGCVHSWIIHVLNHEWDYGLAKLAVKCIDSHIPDQQANQSWLTQRRLLQHAARSTYMLLNGLVSEEDLADEYYNLGLLYANQGKLVEAEQMYVRALQGKEKAWGPEHTSTLDTVNNLGLLYADQGKFDEAEKMYQRTLHSYKTSSSFKDTLPSVTALNATWTLGASFELKTDMTAAKTMYTVASVGYESIHGPDHPRSRLLRLRLSALNIAVDDVDLATAEKSLECSDSYNASHWI